jgi:hypothetical protein
LDRLRRFVGPVGFARKRRLLGAAKCLVVCSQVPETSSLVAREAMAAGTPVVALLDGALVDAVEHGRTGFLAGDEQGLADGMLRAGEIDSEHCRQVARRRFDAASGAKGVIRNDFEFWDGHTFHLLRNESNDNIADGATPETLLPQVIRLSDRGRGDGDRWSRRAASERR